MMLQLASFPILFTFLIFLFMVLMKIYWKRPKHQGGHIPKLPPGPKQLPIIGNLHQLLGSPLLHHTLTDLAKKYGPIMHLKLGEVSAIVISSPKIAEEVLKTHELCFAQRPSVYSADIVTYGTSGIFLTPYGDYWRQIRKVCTSKLLSAKKVQSLGSMREEEARNLVESISFSSSSGNSINLSQKIFQSLTCISSRAAFGNKCKDVDDFIFLTKEALELAGGFGIPDLFPSLKFLPFIINMVKPAMKKMHLKYDMVFNNIINESKVTSATNTDTLAGDHDHLLDVLLKLQESKDSEFSLTTTNVKAIIVDIFGGASDTSAATIEWSMSEMLRNPKVMEIAQAEVQHVLKGKTKIKEQDIQELNYLKLVIKETLRLHPPAALLPRESREKCIINGYDIPMKSKVYINLWAIGRSEEHWDDADCFRPERFDGSSFNYTGTHMEYIPFGAGRRMCPGISFAIASVELQLAVLLYYFNWKLPNGMMPQEVDMTEVLGATMKKKNALYVTATPVFSFA